MRRLLEVLPLIAESESTILLQGETGTGKELVARAIHGLSGRRDGPFVQINCGAISEGLLESELFGHVKGAFTGATADKPGKFELAKGGTIFLDEIGDMSPDLQVKVLRVLEENEFERVGSVQTINTDARIIAATHRDLEEEVQKGNFREDLFYRLYVIPIALTPLKDRRSDIPLLISYFLEKISQAKGRETVKISSKVMDLLLSHSLPRCRMRKVPCVGRPPDRWVRPEILAPLTLSSPRYRTKTALCADWRPGRCIRSAIPAPCGRSSPPCGMRTRRCVGQRLKRS